MSEPVKQRKKYKPRRKKPVQPTITLPTPPPTVDSTAIEIKDHRDRSKLYREKVGRVVDILFNKQFDAAIGVQYMYRVSVEIDGNGVVKRTPPQLIRDPKEIEAGLMFIAEQRQNGITEDMAGDFYYNITVEKPDQRTIKEMMDRAFGTARQSIDFSSMGEKISGIVLTPEREKHIEEMFGLNSDAIDAEVVEDNK